MRSLVILLCLTALVATVAGCGGGGGAAVAPTPTPTVNLSVPAGAAPAGVTPTVTIKTAAELPGQIQGTAFVSAADCRPAGTNFTSAVTLTFTQVTPLGANDTVALFQSDANGNWTQVAGLAQPTISADRLTVTVQVTKFSDHAYYALLKI